jgi:hypothetical protein
MGRRVGMTNTGICSKTFKAASCFKYSPAGLEHTARLGYADFLQMPSLKTA